MDEARNMPQADAADGFAAASAYNNKMSIFSLLVTVLFVMFPRLPLRWLPPVPQPAPETGPDSHTVRDETPRIAAE